LNFSSSDVTPIPKFGGTSNGTEENDVHCIPWDRMYVVMLAKQV